MTKNSRSISVTVTGNVFHYDNPYVQNTPMSAPDTRYTIVKMLDSAVKSAGNYIFTRFNPIARHTHDFGVLEGEKLMNIHSCCFSSTSGPIQGTLYVSNKRVEFISEHIILNGSLCQRLVYIWVNCIQTVKSVNNNHGRVSSEKYIEIITRDGFECTFTGFEDSYDLAFENLFKAIHLCNA